MSYKKYLYIWQFIYLYLFIGSLYILCIAIDYSLDSRGVYSFDLVQAIGHYLMAFGGMCLSVIGWTIEKDNK